MGSDTQNRALFLDRDGVINVDKGYVGRIEEFEFLPGIFALCRTAQDVGLVPIVATNQAGIGRGYYSEHDFHTLTEWMVAEFRTRGIDIGRVYHCPYHPEAGLGEYRRESFDRKPNPGMILRAKDELSLDLSGSVLANADLSGVDARGRQGLGYRCRTRCRRRIQHQTGTRGAGRAGSSGVQHASRHRRLARTRLRGSGSRIAAPQG